MIIDKLRIFYSNIHGDSDLEFPMGYIKNIFTDEIAVKSVVDVGVSIEDYLYDIEEYFIKDFIEIENKNIKLKDIYETKKSYYLLIELDNKTIAFPISQNNLNGLVKNFDTVDDFISKDFVIVNDGIKYPYEFALESLTDVRYLAVTEKLKGKLNVGSVYLNEHGEKSIYLGTVLSCLEYSFLVGKDTNVNKEGLSPTILREVWLPITTREKDKDLNVIPKVEKVFETLQELLEFYCLNDTNIFEPNVLLNKKKEEILNENVVNMLHRLSQLTMFNPACEFKKLILDTENIEIDLNNYIKNYATMKLVSLLFESDFKELENHIDFDDTVFEIGEANEVVGVLLKNNKINILHSLYTLSTYRLNSMPTKINVSWKYFVEYILDLLNNVKNMRGK